MNRIAEEIRSYYGVANQGGTNYIQHYGRSKQDGAPGPGSGRYPLGSGEDPNQHRGDLLTRIKALQDGGMSEKDIATALGYSSTTQLRVAKSNATNERRATQISSARAMLADGKSKAEVARALGINESTLRSLLDERREARTNAAQATADFLKQQVDSKGIIDIGTGVELELGISKEKLNQAVETLKEDGYVAYGGGVPQATNPGKQTNVKVLCPPGTEHKDIYEAFDNNGVSTITDYKVRTDENGVEHFDKGFVYPKSMDSSRLFIRYRDDAGPDGAVGNDKDGVIEIRRNVEDLSLEGSHYAQVRILVDDKKYLKGMAVYSDDIPDGYDVVFNTNKTREQADKVLKKIGDDPNNPFGAALRAEGGQYYYTDENGNRQLGLINKTRHEGDWGDWADNLPSQFLSKQSKQLIDKQLEMSKADNRAEFDEIMSLTNPTVKKELLMSYADECDSTAVHLQAAALPRQKYQVILPLPNLGDNEIFAPGYKDGEIVALIRYPHGGTFEIPILKVNNKNAAGAKMIGLDALDAVGINKNVADRLSGADFDGDTVMVIPCNSGSSKVKITSTPPLKDLEGFDTKIAYGGITKTDEDGNTHYYRDGKEYKPMTKANVQREMGQVSNLITDMTLKGASEEELARAVKHSMVVIDAEKHKLDYHQSEIDNDIRGLKNKYQGYYDDDGNYHGGASTLISRAKGETTIAKRKGQPHIDPDTGEVIYKTDTSTWTDAKGNVHGRTQKSSQMADTKDAYSLSSGTEVENAYADYANYMKSMANTARKEAVALHGIEYNPTAAKTYAPEVEEIKAEVLKAKLNSPRERTAQLATNAEIKAMKKDNPSMTKKEIKKRSQQALSRNRIKFGAQRHQINLTQRMWDAIQAGAVHNNTLVDILKYADGSLVRSYAMPKNYATISSGKQARIKAMQNSGYTIAQIASALGVSTSTVSKYMK